MWKQGIVSLFGLTLVVACRKDSPPTPAADAQRNSGASGVDVSRDVHRGPRYRVDSAGRVETLPPIPVR